MSVKNRIDKLEVNLSSNTNSQLIAVLVRLKLEAGDNTPTTDRMDVAECLRQIVGYVPA